MDNVIPAAQQSSEPARTRAAVLAAMLTTPVVDRWFKMIDADASNARTGAREMGVTGLSDHLDDWAARTRAQGSEFDTHYRRAADRATEIMFGGAFRTAVPPAPAVSTR